MAGYSGTPLARKLGIASNTRLLLDGAPAEFTIVDLPEHVDVRRRTPLREGAESHGRRTKAQTPYDVIVCFCPSAARLAARWPVLHPLTTPAGSLWIAWPKRSSGLQTDLDENAVREFALSHGRVDVKVCAIDDVWSGLKHVVRKPDR